MDDLLGSHDVLVHVAGIRLGDALARLRNLVAPEHVVVVSSAAVNSKHRASASIYRAGEQALLAARPDTVLLRPTMIYGSSRDRNIHHVLAFARRYRFLPLVGDGSALVQPVHFIDVAAAVVALVGVRAPQPLEIGAAAAVTLLSAAETMLAAVGVPLRIIHVPSSPTLRLAQLLDSVRGSRIGERIERMLEDRTADNAAISAATGIVPRSFGVGVRQQVADGFSPSKR
jgi:nucleoside-diphosphate-sugar epimerase